MKKEGQLKILVAFTALIYPKTNEGSTFSGKEQ